MIPAAFARADAAVLLLSMLILGCSTNDNTPMTGPSSSAALDRAVVTQAGGSPLTMASRNDERTRLEGRLAGSRFAPAASGRARWEMRPDRTRFDVEIEDVPTSGLHEVRVNGDSVTSVNVAGGRGEVELDSRHGDTIPKMHADDVVEVFNPAGRLVASGRLQ